MELWTDEIDPADLTGYSRTIADQFGATSALAAIFPDVYVAGLSYEWTVNEMLSELAVYRSFDAETAIGKGGGGEEKIAKLAPLGLKLRFGEYEQLRAMGQNSRESVQAAADRKAQAVTRAVVNRIALLRAEALVSGTLAIKEDGFVATVDFGRASSLTNVAPAALWTAAGADPIVDLSGWADGVEAESGVRPDYTGMNTATFRLLAAAIGASDYVTASTGIVSQETVNTLTAQYDLPPITLLNGSIGGQKLLADGVVVMASSGTSGATPWGQTVESSDSRYNLAVAERPGLVVGAYREDDPDTKWIRSVALALPILANPDSTLSAKVTA